MGYRIPKTSSFKSQRMYVWFSMLSTAFPSPPTLVAQKAGVASEFLASSSTGQNSIISPLLPPIAWAHARQQWWAGIWHACSRCTVTVCLSCSGYIKLTSCDTGCNYHCPVLTRSVVSPFMSRLSTWNRYFFSVLVQSNTPWDAPSWTNTMALHLWYPHAKLTTHWLITFISSPSKFWQSSLAASANSWKSLTSLSCLCPLVGLNSLSVEVSQLIQLIWVTPCQSKPWLAVLLYKSLLPQLYLGMAPLHLPLPESSQ